MEPCFGRGDFLLPFSIGCLAPGTFYSAGPALEVLVPAIWAFELDQASYQVVRAEVVARLIANGIAKAVEPDRKLALVATSDVASGRLVWSGKGVINPDCC